MATVKELRAEAKAAGIKGYSRMRKAELEFKLSLMTEPVTREVSEVRSLRESKITEKETVTMVKTNEVTTAKTKTLSELQDRVEVLKGRYELYCLRVKTSKYHLQDVMSKENRTCYEVMQARDEYKSARYERFRTYVEYRKMLSELRAATEIRKETITMTEKAKLTVKELDEAIKSASNRDEAEALLKEATVKTLRELIRCLNGFDGEWYRARKAELIEALLDYYGSVWEKETETTEQIIAEIESAETLSEIRAVLNECTKGELHEVYESITGNSCESNSWKKDDLVSWYSKKILAHKVCEAQESEKQNEDTAEDPEGTLTVRSILIGSAIEEARAECETLQKDPEILGTSFIVGKRYRYGGNEYELIERDWHTLKFRMNGEKVIRRQLKGACESPTGSCAEFINGLPEAGMYTYADEAINNAEIVAENIAKAGVGKTEKAIEELIEDYVSDEEEKLSEISQKANEIEKCVTVEEISEKLASWDKETALDVCALLLGEERIRYPELYSLKEYAEQILADRSLRESVEADMSDQMPKSIDQEIREAAIKQNICLKECVNANQRYGTYKERAHQLRLELRMNRQYADTFRKSGHEVPEELRMLISSQTEEYHEMRIERFRSYWRCQESKEKYDEAESALNALERVKEELSA